MFGIYDVLALAHRHQIKNVGRLRRKTYLIILTLHILTFVRSSLNFVGFVQVVHLLASQLGHSVSALHPNLRVMALNLDLIDV